MQYFDPVDPTVEEEIWKCNGKNINSAKADVVCLKNWLISQPHLPHILNDEQIKVFLLMSRGSIERSKLKIDMYFTMRTIYHDIFQNSNPFCERLLHARKFMYLVPLPKLCTDLSRILILKVKYVDNPLDLDAYACVAHFLNIIEIRLFEDICAGHIGIMDMENYKIGHLAKLTPTLIKCLDTIATQALTNRMNAIHIINAPNFVDQLLMIIKAVVKPKVANRIVVHKNITSMLEAVDKSILPKEYGGNEKPLDELEEMIFGKFEEYREFFDQRDQWKVNEELRPEKNRNDELLGYHGNFKQLEVD